MVINIILKTSELKIHVGLTTIDGSLNKYENVFINITVIKISVYCNNSLIVLDQSLYIYLPIADVYVVRIG